MEKRIFIPRSDHDDDKIIYERLRKHLTLPSRILKLQILEEGKDVNLPGSTENEQIDQLFNADYILPIISADLLGNENTLNRLYAAKNAKRNFILILGRDCEYDGISFLDEDVLILPDKNKFLFRDRSISEVQISTVTKKIRTIMSGFKGRAVKQDLKFLWMAVLCLICGIVISGYIFLDSNNKFLAILNLGMFFALSITSLMLYRNISFTIHLNSRK